MSDAIRESLQFLHRLGQERRSLGNHLLQFLFMVGECLLRFAKIGNIRVRAEPADHFAGMIFDGKGAGKKPAVSAILTTQRKSIVPKLSALDMRSKLGRYPFNVARMMDLLPTRPLHFFQ